jgi:manganese/iron transport system permease protein/iron/zinc/copper transport system permease protein
MVGVILVVGLLITPAATAYLLSDRLDRMMVLAAFFGVSSVVGGLYLCMWLDSSGGGAIMLFCTFQFLVVLLVAPRYGLLARWLRLRRMVPQQLVEDILASVLRGKGHPVSAAEMAGFIGSASADISQAAKTIARQGLLEDQREGYILTEQGNTEAIRILRAHRLWETYLRHVGMPTGEVHERAHQLEHLHDKAAVDYLDDLLGHPIRDPHGSEIPPDDSECMIGDLCSISKLRHGSSAVIESVAADASDIDLKPGERITIGPRCGNGRAWSVIRVDGTSVVLDHKAADAVMARVTR